MFQNRKKEILIIGCLPPPIGGLSIHVERLLNVLKAENIEYSFIDYLKETNLFNFLHKLRNYKIIHLNAANVYFRLVFAIICKFTNKKLILTLHGNLGRHSSWKNRLDSLSLRLSHIPVLINMNSYELALKLNKRSKLISAFIPPQTCIIEEILERDLNKWKKEYSQIFCTYAFNYHIDHLGREIYGIEGVFNIFKNFKNYGLIISDPSGEYKKLFHSQKADLPKNIYFINQPHSLVGIINISDAFIRATITDGDSLSLKEALYLKKIVFASDCISRPDGCLLYECGNFDDLISRIKQFDWKKNHEYPPVLDGSKELIKIYQKENI